MTNELDLLRSFQNLFQGWWKIALMAVVGALIGLGMSFILPPVFEAEAIFSASIDFTQINFENLEDRSGNPVVFTQYDEDLALQVVQRMLLTKKNEALAFARTLDPDLDVGTFEEDYQIQRYHALWYLRYRHTDPEVAQAIVNFWAEKGAMALRDAQSNGEAETFVIVSPVAEALLPVDPVYQNRNSLVLAGAVIGFVLGVLLVDGKLRFGSQGDLRT